MKTSLRILICLVFLLMIGESATAQVTSFTVNGLTSGITFVTGSKMSWEIGLPPGHTAKNILIIDVNGNGTFEEGTDIPMVEFKQTDGVVIGTDGPNDQDATVNGMIKFSISLGLAPCKWIFGTKDEDAIVDPGVFRAFTVTALQSPMATISGTITAPQGVNKMNIIIEARPDNGDDMNFWHGLTDANGNYSIGVGNSEAIGSSWRISPAEGMNQNFGPYLFAPRKQVFILTATNTNINFQMVKGTVIAGKVTSNSIPIPNAHVEALDAIQPSNWTISFNVNTHGDGSYYMVVPAGKYFFFFNARGYFGRWYNDKQWNQNNAYDTVTVISQDTIWNINADLQKGSLLSGRVTNWGLPVKAQVYVGTQAGNDFNSMSNSTNDNGEYDFTLNPGTYYVWFEYEGSTIYYDQKSYSNEAISITVTSTEDHSNISADFQIGMPPTPPPPEILQVWDVPDDQGKNVFVKWSYNEPAINMNTEIPFIVDHYSIWRLDDPDTTWVGRVDAAHLSTYTVSVPTLFDSTKSHGMFESHFIVIAHYILNIATLTSLPASGYSVDNLAPNTPGGVSSSIIAGNFVLSWNKSLDEDFRYFSVYRSTNKNFSIAGMNPIGMTTDPTFSDPVPIPSVVYYYKITATDFSGNESLPSNSLTTGIAEESSLPTDFVLHQNFPNPFNPSTTIVYELPKESYVLLTVYNMIGQEVRSLINGLKPAGRHTATFDASGLSSGMYIYQLKAEGKVFVQKMNLLK